MYLSFRMETPDQTVEIFKIRKILCASLDILSEFEYGIKYPSICSLVYEPEYDLLEIRHHFREPDGVDLHHFSEGYSGSQRDKDHRMYEVWAKWLKEYLGKIEPDMKVSMTGIRFIH